MFDIDLQRSSGRALLRIIGDIDGRDDRDLLHEALTFVQAHDHLILDLAHMSSLDALAAGQLHDLIQRRSSAAETIVVSSRETISMALVLHNVDRVSPIVRKMTEAVALLDRWSAGITVYDSESVPA